ncbi:Eco57I restriction-modification methylase domain-containing protein [Ligilactobacillus agilis]|uniref:Eco57I restriction-modification methylase domain-containing protein n=1 Tax=Ligilactobacillus agilis TaxID=1601 RepID=UPI001956B7BA|nr:hypothetical protein [Ligilactobacillus agilis]MBM6763778.1 hypothetical protein [Ligilactobacillus agilis]
MSLTENQKINIAIKKLHSQEYLGKLSDLTASIIKHTTNASNEATVASIFERELYYFIRHEFDIQLNIDKEQTSKDIDIHSFKGRIDAITTNFVIEYKKPEKLHKDSDIKKAQKQLSNYLEQLKRNGNNYFGIVTDGTFYISAYFVKDSLKLDNIRQIDEIFFIKFIEGIFNTNKKQMISRNIIDDFSLDKRSNNALNNLQKTLFYSIRNAKKLGAEKVLMLFEEWMDIFHLSLNDDGKSNTIIERRNALSEVLDVPIENTEQEYQGLYALQTAYAILVKCFALKIIPKINFSSEINYFSDLLSQSPNDIKKVFSQVEDGYTFNVSNITNLIEGDFFSWYLEDLMWSDKIAQSIKSILITISYYSDASLSYQFESLDLFKDLYMNVMPQPVRKAFGEVFTPDWLADNVVTTSLEYIDKEEWTFLDPTSGSGTFIFKAIEKIVEKALLEGKDNKYILNQILTRIHGIDLSPLSVLTARVSFLLAIRPFIDEKTENFEIPIYLGDSARLPLIIKFDNKTFVSYSITTRQGDINLTLPSSFVESSDFIENIRKWQTLVKAENVELLSETIKKEFSSEKEIQHFEKEILSFSRQLVTLHKKNWDGIWIKIITNFILPARIKNIDIIAGNPPWVKWENLPSIYANKIKNIAGKRDLFSKKNKGLGGGINLNIAALISNITADNWLNKDGIQAFLMPDTLLNSDSYEGWRRFPSIKGNKMFLSRIDDWSNAGSPFKPVQEKFLTYFIAKKPLGSKLVKYNKNFPRKLTIEDINSNKSWKNVEEFFSKEEGLLVQLSNSSNRFSRIFNVTLDEVEKLKLLYGKNDYKPRQGVELTPREVYVFEKDSDGTFRNLDIKGTRIKPNHFKGLKLENEIVRPLLQSKQIGAFSMVNRELIQYGFYPYDKDANIIPLKNLLNDYPQISDYILKQKEFIDKQSERSKTMARGNEFYSLSKVGNYTTFDYAVAFRDNTKMVATFIDNSTKKMIPVKHAPFISMDKNGVPLTKEEAKYLTGIMNMPIVNTYFKTTYSERSFSINFDMKIIKYTAKKFQKDIVKLVDYILHNNLDEIEKRDISKRIEDIYLKYLENH